MSRKARVVIPHTPHHVTQRGHNKQTVFFDDCDYKFYLVTTRKWTGAFRVKIYGYCLMTNHVNLLLDLGPDVTSLAKVMKRVSGKYTRRVNRLRHSEARCLDIEFLTGSSYPGQNSLA